MANNLNDKIIYDIMADNGDYDDLDLTSSYLDHILSTMFARFFFCYVSF